MMKSYLALLVIAVVLYQLFDPLNLKQSQNSDHPSHLVPQTCWFSQPSQHKISCYRFIPTDLDGSASDFSLPVALFHARKPAADQPKEALAILLTRLGEPSDINAQYMSWWLDYMRQFGVQRDIVLLTQRGIGRSQPALQCEDQWRYAHQLFQQPFDATQRLQQHRQYQQQCWQFIQQRQLDLSTLSVQQDAADMAQLMSQLGYRRWHLLGDHYGADIGLELVRQAPATLASVSISAPTLAQHYDYAPVQQQLESLCQQDPDCNNLFSVDKAIQHLQPLAQHPYVYSIPSVWQKFLIDEPVHTVIDQSMTQFVIWMQAQYEDAARGLPDMLYQTLFDDSAQLASHASMVVNDRRWYDFNQPVIWAHYCNDRPTPFQQLDNWPKIVNSSECFWPHATTPAPIQSDHVVPLLWIDSALDIITNRAQLAQQLPAQTQRLYSVEQGYGLRGIDACVLATLNQFMRQPDAAIEQDCGGPILLNSVFGLASYDE